MWHTFALLHLHNRLKVKVNHFNAFSIFLCTSTIIQTISWSVKYLTFTFLYVTHLSLHHTSINFPHLHHTLPGMWKPHLSRAFTQIFTALHLTPSPPSQKTELRIHLQLKQECKDNPWVYNQDLPLQPNGEWVQHLIAQLGQHSHNEDVLVRGEIFPPPTYTTHPPHINTHTHTLCKKYIPVHQRFWSSQGWHP